MNLEDMVKEELEKIAGEQDAREEAYRKEQEEENRKRLELFVYYIKDYLGEEIAQHLHAPMAWDGEHGLVYGVHFSYETMRFSLHLTHKNNSDYFELHHHDRMLEEKWIGSRKNEMRRWFLLTIHNYSKGV